MKIRVKTIGKHREWYTNWTFPYQDARVMQIQTPSNCDEVMLIDPRGKVYGPRKPRDYINNTIKWNQPYRPGKWW